MHSDVREHIAGQGTELNVVGKHQVGQKPLDLLGGGLQTQSLHCIFQFLLLDFFRPISIEQIKSLF